LTGAAAGRFMRLAAGTRGSGVFVRYTQVRYDEAPPTSYQFAIIRSLTTTASAAPVRRGTLAAITPT
jgi:hypothetical protein